MIQQALKTLAAITVSMTMLTACSDQYKIVNPGASGTEVEETMDRIQASSNEAELIADLREDPTSIVYFAKSGTSGLVPETVFSFGHVVPFLAEYQSLNRAVNIFEVGLTEASVAFLDGISTNGNARHFALMIELVFGDGSTRHFAQVSYPGEYGFTDEVFEAQFPAENGNTIVLRTYDLSDDFAEALGDNIQFKVYEIENGQEYEIGQFSTLASFGS